MATGQESYCSAGNSVDAEAGGRLESAGFGVVLVMSKFWSRSVMQPFQVLWLSGTQLVELVHFFLVLPFLPAVWVHDVVVTSLPLLSSQSLQSIQVAA